MCPFHSLNDFSFSPKAKQAVRADRTEIQGNRSTHYPTVSGLELKNFGNGKGTGVVTTKPLPAGKVVAPYFGELKTRSQWEKDKPALRQEGHKYSYTAGYNSSVVIDATKKGNISRFINSSHDPNCKAEKV